MESNTDTISSDIAKYPGFAAFNEQVDIELFNDIIAFIITTTAADSMPVIRKLSSNHLWFSKSGNDNIQAQYGFRYFGELLERFEDKAGSNIADIRAIALAMAYTKELFTDDMFVGNQKNNFTRKITRLSASDMYLKGALYLLNKDEADTSELFDELTKVIYTQTEELIFVISLYDDFEQAFLAFKPQLINLIGCMRSISLSDNLGIYYWLIKRLRGCAKIKEIRTKDMPLFRALMELPVSFVKAESRYHSVLLENGYTAEEIVFLNSCVIRVKPTAGTIDSDSIVAEKIAVEMCKTHINSGNTHMQEVYEHLGWLLKKYDEFNIKINGYRGIYEAIVKDIKIINPQTFIWLFKLIKPKDVFHLDIMDEKWDILSRELDSAAYRKLFNKQLTKNPEFTKAQVTELIRKYDILTGQSFLAQFEYEHSYDNDGVFALLVNNGFIDLVALFESCPDIDNTKRFMTPLLEYISQYIRGIQSRKAFDFYRYFLSRYSFDDMHRLFIEKANNYGGGYKDYFFLDALYKGPARNYGDNKKERFSIKRSFLSDDEHRELFGWLDDYIFQYKADKYIEFAALSLVDSFVITLFPQDELRLIYDKLCGLEIDVVKQNSQELKNKFLSEAELQAEREAELARTQERKRQDRERQIKELRDELVTGYNGTFESLNKYIDKHKYSYQNHADAMSVAAEYFEVTLLEKNFTLDKNEFCKFLRFGGMLLKEGYIGFNDLKKHISMAKEDVKYAENN